MKLTREEKIKKLQSVSTKSDTSKWQKAAEWDKKHIDAIDDYIRIAARIAIVLDDKKMKQKDLAKVMGVSKQALTRIMQARQNLSLNTIRKIERALEVTLITVLEKSEPIITTTVQFVPVAIHYNLKAVEEKTIIDNANYIPLVNSANEEAMQYATSI